MEPLGALVAALAAGSIGYLIAWTTGRRRFLAWQRAASAAGLERLERSTVAGVDTRLTGFAGPLRIRLESYHRGRHEYGTRILADGLRHGPYDLTMRGEGFASAIEKTFGESDVELGDPAFDGQAYIQGAPALIRAVFDAPTRQLVGRLMGGALDPPAGGGGQAIRVRALLSGGELRVDVREGRFRGASDLPPWSLGALADIARRLVRPDDLARQIAGNTTSETLARVRVGNLQMLGREFASHPATGEALRLALGDPDAEVRLVAATALGPEGRQALIGLASDGGVPDEVAARAIEAIGGDLPSPMAIALLEQAAKEGRPGVARQCVAVLGRHGGEGAVGALTSALGSGDETVAVAAAAALGATTGPPREDAIGEHGSAPVSPGRADRADLASAERELIAALASDSAPLRAAAAVSLGAVGSPLAVLPLREAAGAHPLDAALRKASREAVATIQSRVSGASPGQLSLTTESGGELTLSGEERRGRISLDESARAAPLEPVTRSR